MHELLVRDQSAIPEDQRFEHRFSCSELHPGVCAHSDAAVYSDCLVLARSLERCLSQDIVGSFLAVNYVANRDRPRPHGAENEEEGPGPADRLFVYLALVKARRFHAQATHCLVRCIVHDDGEAVHLSLAQASYRKWDFITLWSLAKELLYMNCESVHLKALEHSENTHDGTVTPSAADLSDKGIEVWPTEFKRPRPVREGDDVGIPDRFPHQRRKQKTSFGVKARILCCFVLSW